MSEYDCSIFKDASIHHNHTPSSTKCSSFEHSPIGLEALFMFDILTVMNSEIQSRLNSGFFLLKSHAKSRGFLTSEEKQARKNSLLFKRSTLLKYIKKMLWTGHIKLSQRPFWIWKMLVGDKRNKLEFTQRNQNLILRAFVNRLSRSRYLGLKETFHCIKLANFKEQDRKIKNSKKRNQKRLVRKQSFAIFNKQLRIYFKILNEHLGKRVAEYINEWKNCQWWYEASVQEVNCSKLNVKNYSVLSKPKIELVYYEKNISNPALKAFFHSLCHMKQERLKYGFDKLSWLSKTSISMPDPISGYKNLIYGDRKYKFFKIVLRSIVNSKEAEDKKKKIFNFRRSPFLYVYILSRLELVFRRGQYFTGLKKLILSV